MPGIRRLPERRFHGCPHSVDRIRVHARIRTRHREYVGRSPPPRGPSAGFPTVHCYPKDAAAWSTVTPDAAGLALVWSTRFEVHVDQVLALADRVEPARRTA